MKNTRTNLAKYDVTAREQSKLNRELAKELSPTEAVPVITVGEARRRGAQLEVISDRETTRVLIISRDTKVLNQETRSLDRYIELADVFDEVHVVVMQSGGKTRNPVLRVSPNTWLYVVSATSWWMPWAALRMIAEQLHFADGFRPDVIIARDPYESALVAYLAGRTYSRPTQLHILEDFTNPKISAQLEHPWVRAFLARHLIPRFRSIRTYTDALSQYLRHVYPRVPDIATLPRFYNYHAPEPGAVVNLKEKFTQFSVIIVYVGALGSDSLAYQAMDAARALLTNPKIGLLFVGDGPGRAELAARAALLGITTQIVFERDVPDITNYIATADILIVPDISEASDQVVIRGAYAGVPIVAATTSLRSDLFVHGESILLAIPGDSLSLWQALNRLISDIPLRRTLRDSAYALVTTRLHEDPVAYRLAYRDSVEAALFADETEVQTATSRTTTA